MTTPHSTLTGTDLHEIKGAAAATSGQIPIANGTGGAPFGLLGGSSLSATANPFGRGLLHVREEQASGVATGSPLAGGSWTVAVLNTVKTNEISGASLAANGISLPAGTYFIEASLPVYLPNSTPTSNSKATIALYNSTAASFTIFSQSLIVACNAGGANAFHLQTTLRFGGRFTIAVPSTLYLQFFCIGNNAVPQAMGSGGTEVYGEALIWQIA